MDVPLLFCCYEQDIVNSPKFKYIILKWLFKIIAKYSEIPKKYIENMLVILSLKYYR